VDALMIGAQGEQRVFTLSGAEAPYRVFVEGMGEGAATVDSKGLILFANQALARLLRRPLERVIGATATNIVAAEHRGELDALLHGPAGGACELTLAAADGTFLPVHVGVTPLPGDGGGARAGLFVSDLSDRTHRAATRKMLEESERSRRAMLSILEDQVRAQERILESEEKLRAITTAAMDAVVLMDPDGRIAFWNAAAERMFGYASSEAVGADLHALIAPNRYHEAFRNSHARFLSDGTGAALGRIVEISALRKGGDEFPVELAVSAVNINGGSWAVGLIRDISERKAREHALDRVNRALRTLSAGNEALVRATDEPGLLKEMVRILRDVGGYPIAVVGYARDDPERLIEIQASEGLTPDDLARFDMSWGDNERGRSVSGLAIREGTTRINRGVQTDPAYARWRELPQFRTVRATLALPLRLAPSDPPFGALGLGTADKGTFDEHEVKLLEELAGDLAYGIASLRARAAQRAADEQIRVLARFPEENPNPIMRVGVDGVLVYANPASEPFMRACSGSVGGPAPTPCAARAGAALARRLAME
jgi:PAS domain S-box-containing protein